MRAHSLAGALAIVIAEAVAGFIAPVPATAQSNGPPARSIPVYITDFELRAAGESSGARSAAAMPAKKMQPAVPGANVPPPSPSVYQDTDTPSVQARRLTDFFSLTLLQTFHNNGYNVASQPASSPNKGVLIRGIFAEYDDQNRVRRAILGAPSTSPKFALYVGLFNLSRPDQPLYQPAAAQAPDNRYGPVITLNNYIPLVKFELDKNPTEEDVRRVCGQIVSNLAGLLTTNASAFAQ